MRTALKVLGGLIVALLLAGGITWFAIGLHKGSASTNDKEVDLTAQYTVKITDLLPAEAKCTTNVFDKSSLNGPFLYDDAVDIAMKSSDKDSSFAELMTAICTKPTTGVAYVSMLSAPEATIGGHKLSELNQEWVSPMLAKAQQDGGLTNAFLAYKSGTNEVVVTDEYQRYASLINTLLMRFPERYIANDERSLANWHVLKENRFTVSAALPFAVRNTEYEESRPALWFRAVDKAGTCDLVVGANLGDERPEIGSCPSTPYIPTVTPTVTEPAPVASSPPPTRTTTTVVYVWLCDSTGQIVKVPAGQTSGYTEPVAGKCEKLRTQDPAQNNNAGNGPGQNQNPGPGATTTPTTVPTAPRTTPAAPAPTTVTRTTQAPPPEASVNPVPTAPSETPRNTGDPGGFN